MSAANTPVVVTPQTQFERWKFLITPVVLVLLIVGQNRGWWTAEQAAVMSNGESQSPSSPDPQPSTLDPQLERLLDLFRQIIDGLPKPPAPPQPHTDPLPTPDPQPPTPVPAASKIIISDETGKPVSAATVDAGALCIATAPHGVNIGWQHSRHGTVRIVALPGTLGYAFSLDSGAWIELFLTDFAAKTQTSVRISCNHAPQPPPGPHPVDPTPPPPAPAAKHLSLAVIHDVKQITPATAIVLNATSVWNEFTAAGSDWMFYDLTTKEPRGIKAIADAGAVTVPVLVIYDQATRSKLAAQPLPTSVEELRKVVSQYGGTAP